MKIFKLSTALLCVALAGCASSTKYQAASDFATSSPNFERAVEGNLVRYEIVPIKRQANTIGVAADIAAPSTNGTLGSVALAASALDALSPRDRMFLVYLKLDSGDVVAEEFRNMPTNPEPKPGDRIRIIVKKDKVKGFANFTQDPTLVEKLK